MSVKEKTAAALEGRLRFLWCAARNEPAMALILAGFIVVIAAEILALMVIPS